MMIRMHSYGMQYKVGFILFYRATHSYGMLKRHLEYTLFERLFLFSKRCGKPRMDDTYYIILDGKRANIRLRR
jgi:hypothetical protein